jgi:hypothetical protein
MHILRSKSFLQLSLVVVSFTFLACGSIPKSSHSQTTPIAEPLKSSSPAAETTPRPFDPKLDIGLVVAGSECSELFIRDTELKADDEIQVILADDNPHKKLLAKVVGPNNCPRYSQSGIEEIVLDGDESTPNEYEIRFAENDETESGFAVISAKASVEIKRGVAQITASNVRVPLMFRVCNGNESYHMTVWEGKPLVGKRVWYSYMSLSYGTVPTCRPADYK